MKHILSIIPLLLVSFLVVSCGGEAQGDPVVSSITLRGGEMLSIYQVGGPRVFHVENVQGDAQHPQNVPSYILSIEDNGENILVTFNRTEIEELGYGWQVIPPP